VWGISKVKPKPSDLLLARYVVTPIDNACQLPGILIQLHLQFAVRVDDELRSRKQHAGVFVFALLVDVDLTSAQVVRLRPGVMVSLAERDPAIGDEADLASGGSVEINPVRSTEQALPHTN
jgi:hypothetical protein